MACRPRRKMLALLVLPLQLPVAPIDNMSRGPTGYNESSSTLSFRVRLSP